MPRFCLFSYAILNYIFECYRNTYLSQRNEFNRVYFLQFCTKYDAQLSKYGIELIVALSSTNAKKMKLQITLSTTALNFITGKELKGSI